MVMFIYDIMYSVLYILYYVELYHIVTFTEDHCLYDEYS